MISVCNWEVILTLVWSQIKEALQKMGAILPMNIFLRQELDRMQKVLIFWKISHTIITLKKYE